MAITNVTERQLKAYYPLRYNRTNDMQMFNQFVWEVPTDQPDGEKFGGEEPGTGMIEKGVENAYRTTIAKSFVLPNRTFHNGRILTREDVESNKIARAQTKVTELADYAAEHPADLVEDLILAGATLPDPLNPSVNFFSTSHPLQDGNVQSNLYDGGTVPEFNITDADKPTVAEWVDAMLWAATQLMLMTNSAGQYTNSGQSSFTIAVGRVLWPSLLKALAQSNLANGESNVFNNAGFTFRAMLLKRETTDTRGHIFLDGQKSMIMQWFKRPNTIKTDKVGGEHYEMNDEMRMRVSGSYNSGFLHYVNAARFNFTE